MACFRKETPKGMSGSAQATRLCGRPGLGYVALPAACQGTQILWLAGKTDRARLQARLQYPPVSGTCQAGPQHPAASERTKNGGRFLQGFFWLTPTGLHHLFENWGWSLAEPGKTTELNYTHENGEVGLARPSTCQHTLEPGPGVDWAELGHSTHQHM